MGYWAFTHRLDSLVKLGVNPDRLSQLSVMLSAAFIFTRDVYLLMAALAAILVLDWLDGAVSRNLARKSGRKMAEITDIGCDRVSELVIFSAYPLLLPLAAINIFLSALRLKRSMPIVLPLRHILLALLAAAALGVLPGWQALVMLV